MKHDIHKLKDVLYAGILCDVLDQMGYRNQALSLSLIHIFFSLAYLVSSNPVI